jgi:hypothetical protein
MSTLLAENMVVWVDRGEALAYLPNTGMVSNYS